MVDPRQSIHQEPTWLLVGRGCQALGQPSRWTTVTPGAREPQPPQLSWLVGKEIWHHCFPASEVCDVLGVGRFSSPDHHLCWGKEPSKLPGLPATRQTLGIFLENCSSILSQSCWYFKFLFQVGTNPNSGFGHFCLKQRIFLCMVPIVIMYDKILWILFRHLCLCICDFPILIKSNIFGIAHKKKLFTVNMYIIFLITWKTLKKYHFVLRWAIQVLHERMGLKGKELVLRKWAFIVKQKNNSEGGALSKTKLHVMSSLFHFSRNLFAFIITFLKSKTLPFIPLLFRMLSGTVYSFCFSVVAKLMGFS